MTGEPARRAAGDTPRRAAARTINEGVWWAVTRGPDAMPCLFGRSRADVKGQADDDEYVVRVRVSPVLPTPRRCTSTHVRKRDGKRVRCALRAGHGRRATGRFADEEREHVWGGTRWRTSGAAKTTRRRASDTEK